MNIHPSACIHPDSKISKNVTISAYSIIDAHVVVEEGVQIGSFCHIYQGCTLHRNVKIFDSCIVGSPPQDLKYEGEPSYVVIGENTQIREYGTINGSTKASSGTIIGKDCLIMSYVHIAHDCFLRDNLILANGTQLCGHVYIDSDTVISGMCAFHQWTSIGRGCYIAGMIKVDKDILPFSKILGLPMAWAGINVSGLKKQDKEKMNLEQQELELKNIYRKSKSEENLIESLKRYPDNVLYQDILKFLSKRNLRPLLPTWL